MRTAAAAGAHAQPSNPAAMNMPTTCSLPFFAIPLSTFRNCSANYAAGAISLSKIQTDMTRRRN
jgi:hypothetical protein